MSSNKKFDPRKKYFNKNLIPQEDEGIIVADMLALLSGSPYESIILKDMDINEILNDKIEIPGASYLTTSVVTAMNKYIKYDVVCEYQNLSFKGLNDENDIEISLSNIRNVFFSDNGRTTDIELNAEEALLTRPVYSVRSDFFSNFYNMGRYATSLLDAGQAHIVAGNMQMIQEIYKNEDKKFDRKYRILRDKDNNNYLRAIISTNGYKDYHIGISVFITLVALHRDSKTNGSKYRIVYCEYNESSIRVFFEKEGEVEIEGFGRIKYGIELSNDETKKSSLNMSGVYAVVFGKGANNRSLYMDSKSNSAYNIVNITHSVKPENLSSRLEITENISEVEKDIFDDISSITKVKKPDQLRFYFKRKIEESKNQELNKYKNSINQIVTNKIDTVYGLLTMMEKIDDIVQDEDLEAKEFLRYLMHDVVTLKKPKRKPKRGNQDSDE